MAVLRKKTPYTRLFLMVKSTGAGAHILGQTGANPIVTLGKAGAAFTAAEGIVSELTSGWYKINLTVNDTDTIGDLGYKITGTGADPTDFIDQIDLFSIFDEILTLDSTTGLDFIAVQIFGPSLIFNATPDYQIIDVGIFEPLINFDVTSNYQLNLISIFEPSIIFNAIANFALTPNNVIDTSIQLDQISSTTFFGGTGFFFIITFSANAVIDSTNIIKHYPIIRFIDNADIAFSEILT